jgi:hypothetical protein
MPNVHSETFIYINELNLTPTELFFMDFSRSILGRTLILPPFKEDATGDYADLLMEINYKYLLGLQDTAAVFYYDILSNANEIYIDDIWLDYINKLKDNGLDEYHELINRFEFSFGTP